MINLKTWKKNGSSSFFFYVSDIFILTLLDTTYVTSGLVLLILISTSCSPTPSPDKSIYGATWYFLSFKTFSIALDTPLTWTVISLLSIRFAVRPSLKLIGVILLLFQYSFF